MNFNKVNLIAEVVESSTIKEVCYISSVFKQNVFTNADGDIKVEDQDIDVNLNLNIPVHTFDSFINVLLELRKDFNVACAYSKEPISYENHPFDNDNIVCDKSYAFVYWHIVHNNVLYSNAKQYNVFIYLSEFGRYANLYVTHKKK